MTIRNPVEWSADGLSATGEVLKNALANPEANPTIREVPVRQISLSDLGEVLRQGWTDFLTYRTDVLFLCLIYPLAGLLVAMFTYNNKLLPLLFPIVSGFALIGPFAAAGLYEMSRRRERGETVTWIDAFDIFRSPSTAAIVKLALLMTAIFVVWLAVAMGIFHLVFGADMPTSLSAFVRDVFATGRGWALILVGGAVGFLFALLALAISVVSFPVLLDKPVTIQAAIRTSIRAVAVNPMVMPVWGLIVAACLVAGAVPLLLGMIVVMPVLGHATWHLYRKVVA